ncbi:MAG TPA: ABC transporter substrate-binding protein, partial [Thermoanaerobaculia bacterium]
AVSSFLAKEQPFALTASSFLGAESAIETAIEDSGTPAVAAFAATVLPDAHYTFALFGDVTDTIRRHDPKARIFDGKDLGTSGRVYVPMALASEAIFNAPPSVEVIVAAPAWSDDVDPEALAELRALSPGGTHSRSTQMAALASAKILIEALRRAGHDVTREAVIETIESLYRFRTGLTPPLSFGPNRHAGTSGAFLLQIDREKKALREPQWVE